MHFYSFNIGDFASSTVHLDWDERAAFRALLDEYYRRELPLSPDPREIYRRVRAGTIKQKKAVDSVLLQFFTHTAEGWESGRCEREIAMATTRRTRASAGGHARARRGARGEPDGGSGGEAPSGSACADPPGGAQAGVKQPASTAPNPNPLPNPNPTHASSGAACGAAPRVAPGTDIPDPPLSIGDWTNFFRRQGFDSQSGLASPRLRGEMKRWTQQGIGLSLMREAIDQARLRLGAMPDSPFYLVPIVAELAALREAPADASEEAALGHAPSAPRPVIEDI